jgi:outer membrane protein assembly factor BamB
MMSAVRLLSPAVVCFAMTFLFTAATAAVQAADDPADILRQSGVRGGFVAHINCGDGTLTSGLRPNASYQVQGLTRDPAAVAKARGNVAKAGAYGDVAIDRLAGSTLPYIDNLVNLLVVEGDPGVPDSELQRVLVPNGVILRRADAGGKWTKAVKPRPAEIDDWSHYLHDPSGNAVAHDKVVAPPRHLQWVGNPRWSRHHDRMASMSAMTSTNGRLFYIMDEGSRISIQLPSKWKLIARDAFNGVVLWKRDIAEWNNQLWPLKSGPTQLARRLVSTDREVFATLSFEAPLTCLDAATGETLRTYEGSGSCEEVLYEDGILYLVANKREHELKEYAPLHNTGDQGRVAKDYAWDENDRVVMAYNAATGKQLWAKQTKVTPLTLALGPEHAFFHDGERVVAINRKSGEEAWRTEPVNRRARVTFNFGPRLVVYDNVVLFAGGDGKMAAFNGADGKQLWTASHPNSGYQSPQDLMVVDGLVWCAPTTSGKDTGTFTGRDPKTGEVKKEFAPDVDTYWFHHRCYIAKATDNFIIPSRTGIEFVDTEKEHWDIHHWVRGGCLYGVLPCNGLVYAPPHNCACYPEAKLYGLNAMAPVAPTRPAPGVVSDEGRLEKGPAFDRPLAAVESEEDRNLDWATYRHDAGRTGATTQKIEAQLKPAWSVKLGGKLTPPVSAGGRTYVAQVDQHTLHCLDAATGKTLWTFTAGGRIDSPPTITRGRAVFGSVDGYLYTVDAANGELAWRFRAAPEDRRHMAFEQLESVWPVHGSALAEGDAVYCTAGRSAFLDGGIRVIKLDVASGKKLAETLIDDRNPATGKNLQELVQVLQMPVGLPDILSSDGKCLYMRSQKFDLDANRLEIGPISSDPVAHSSVQRGEGAHLFAPMGFLDDTWFHRSYWVFGRNFSGGHNGYYQAGRFAPAGQILVTGGGYVFGYGRKPEYLKWTTTLEHQLFAASTEAPEVPEDRRKLPGGNRQQARAASQQSTVDLVQFSNVPATDPTGKPLTVEAWINATRPDGVIIARGGPAEGWALTLESGKPAFHIRAKSQLTTVRGPRRIVGEWHHVAGVLTADKKLKVYVDGKKAAEVDAPSLLTTDPKQPMAIGADENGAVGDYQSPFGFTGDDDLKERFEFPQSQPLAEINVLVDFNDGSARDLSRTRNNGTIEGPAPVEGKVGMALRFKGAVNNANAYAQTDNKLKPAADNAGIGGNSFVAPHWKTDVPIYVRGMVLADRTLFIVGPPDLIDEEDTFARLTKKDAAVKDLLNTQDQALAGAKGGILLAVNADTGETLGRIELGALPVWDGLAAARGRMYLSTLDGSLIAFEK